MMENPEFVDADSPFHGRRTANYRPNIWNYDHIQSLTTKCDEEEYGREAAELKKRVAGMILAAPSSKDSVHKLELLDAIHKLSLSHYFETEIGEAVKELLQETSEMDVQDDVYATALRFRVLREHGCPVSKDVFLRFMDVDNKFISTKAMLEIFEASYLLAYDESMVLNIVGESVNPKCLLHDDHEKKIFNTPKCPSRWTVNWFEIKKHLKSHHGNKSLCRLATLSFNMIQSQHHKDLKEVLRWWINLGVLEDLPFARDRVVESFLWAVGVAYEPGYGTLRKWLTKVIVLVLIIDDVYDIYGSIQELEQFTLAIERWDPREIHPLPRAMKKYFWALYDTIEEINDEVQKEKGGHSVLPLIKKVWTEFCKGLLVEAKWYHTAHTPSLLEYLDNGWITSSGPLLSLHILLGMAQDSTQIIKILIQNQEIIHNVSLIIRLCNDQGTSNAELERGDAPSSILCHMREANVGEDEARDHIREIIKYSWKKINGLYLNSRANSEQQMSKYIINMARVVQFIYQSGDGFGAQHRETQDKVLSCLIEHLPLIS